MNTEWSFCDASTGLFLRGCMSAPRGIEPAGFTPPGAIAVMGRHDPDRSRVELRPDDFGDVYPVVVPWQPPPPADTALVTWAWDAQSERWVGSPTIDAIALEVRAERATRLAACDWVVARSLDTGEPVPDDWRAYRQALRDVTGQPGFPASISWPAPPSA